MSERAPSAQAKRWALAAALAAQVLCVCGLRFAVVTDLHYDPLVSPEYNQSTYCRPPEAAGAQFHPELFYGRVRAPKVTGGGQYGRYMCDSPRALVDSAAAHMRATLGSGSSGAVSFGLVLGDNVAHFLDNASFLEATKYSATLLKDVFGDIPVVPAVGNNDVLPDYEAVCNSAHYAMLADLWVRQGWLDADQVPFFRYSGAHSRVVPGTSLRVIALNTNLFSFKNRAPAPLDDCGQLAWLSGQLATAAAQGEDVYIIGHIPPIVDWYGRRALWREDARTAFWDVVGKSAGRAAVRALLFAHTHKDEFRVVPEGTLGGTPPEQPAFGVLVNPSVSPNTENNPAWRIYETARYEPASFQQYYLDLRRANALGRAEWAPDYNSTAIAAPGLGVAGLAALRADMLRSSAAMAAFVERLAVHYSSSERLFACLTTTDSEAAFLACYDEWVTAP